MAVSLTISETLDGTQIADTILGAPAQTGCDLGAVANNSYAPLISKTLNQGKQDIYIRHDAAVDPITSCKSFLQIFGTGTGYAYGGNNTNPTADFNMLKALGFASGNSKNNADGNSGGIWIDHRWNSNDTTRFDQATYPTKVKIYGDNNTDGIDLASAFGFLGDGCVYDAGGSVETAASAAEDGKIGKNGDTVRGDNCHVQMRIFLPTSHTTGGYCQVEWVIAYSYTA